MKIKTTFFLLCLLSLLQSLSQKQTNFLVLCINAGLDFNSGSPVVVTNGALNTTEGCSAISGTNGSPAFLYRWRKCLEQHTFCNAQWDRTTRWFSTTQSALIVKKRAAPTCIIFSLCLQREWVISVIRLRHEPCGGQKVMSQPRTLCYSENVTEKLSAVHHCNGTDIWVTIPRTQQQEFLHLPSNRHGLWVPQ